MTAEKIIEQIKKESENDIKQIIKEAEEQAKIIIKESKKEAEKEAEKILSNGKQQSKNIKKIIISKANQDTKREKMNSREKLIEQCFTKAHHEFSITKGKDYEKIIQKLIKDGTKKIGGKCSVYVSRTADKKIVEDLGLSIEGRIETSGGIILKSADGRVTLNYTFDGILKREKDKIRRKVGKILFS